MRATRWLLGCLAVLLAALLAAAWLVPPLLDGARFQAPLQRIAGTLLGTQVRIAGPIRLALLPQPELAAGRLDIAAAGPGGGALTARGLRLQLFLWPLLGGHIDAREIVLEQPDLRLPHGFGLPDLLGARPAWLGGVAARIEDGRIEAAGMALRGVEASLAADALSGDVAASGAADLAAGRWHFEFRLTRPGRDGSAGLDAAVSGLGSLSGTRATLTGRVSGDGSLSGQVTALGPDLSLLLPVPALRFRAEGRVSVAQGLAAADDLSVTLGDQPATGAVALRLSPVPRLDLALATARLDLDPWLALLRRGAAAQRLLAGLPLGIDLSADAATLGGGTMRGLRTGFDVATGRVTVREFQAILPGEAELRAAGTLSGQPVTRVDADVHLAAPALRATLAWAAPLLPRLDGLPADLLRTAAISAHVAVRGATLTLSGLAGTLDGGGIGGSLTCRRGQSPGSRDRIGGALSLDRLDLDPWLRAGSGGPDLDLRVEARQAALRGLALRGLRLDLRRDDGTLILRDGQAVAGRVRLHASGRRAASGRLDAVRLELDAPHLADLPAPALPAWLPAGATLRREPLHATLDASGEPAALSLSLHADLGAAEAELDLMVDLAAGAWRGTIELRAPSARALLDATGLANTAGLPPDAGWLGEGLLALRATASGTTDRLDVQAFELAAGGLRAQGSVQASWAGPVRVSGTVDAAALPLPPLGLGMADAVLLGGAPGGQVSLHLAAQSVLAGGAVVLAPASAELSLADGRLRLERVRAGLAGGTVQGQATVDLASAPPSLAVQARAQGVSLQDLPPGLPVSLASGRADAAAALEGAGHSLAALRSTLHGTAQVTVTAGALGGVALTGLPPDLPERAVAAALRGGATGFDQAQFAAAIDHGIVTLTQGNVVMPAGRIDIGGSYDLTQDAPDLLLSFTPDLGRAAAPVIGLRLVGPAGRVQRIPQLAGLAGWRAAQDQP